MDQAPIRRKLVKGSLAAPLVMTVSKAAIARTSIEACMDNPVVAPDAVAERDSAMRVARDVYEIREGETSLRGGSTLKKLDGEYILGFDEQTLYRLDRNGDSISLTLVETLDFRSTRLFKRQKGQIYVLAYFDDKGAVVGLAPDANGGIAATTSCYCSVFPNATPA
jgi:hypothetical protein